MFGHQHLTSQSSAITSYASNKKNNNNYYYNNNNYDNYYNNINTHIFDHHKSNGYHGNYGYNERKTTNTNNLNVHNKKKSKIMTHKIKMVESITWKKQWILKNSFFIKQKYRSHNGRFKSCRPCIPLPKRYLFQYFLLQLAF